MLNEHNCSYSNGGHIEGFTIQFKIIRDAFEGYPSRELRKIDIAKRLSLIDLFYTTNFNRFAEFGLSDLSECIWNLCSDNYGKHSDDVLVKKVEDFVNDCYENPAKARNSEIFVKFFSPSAKFGITKVKFDTKPEGSSSQSLISKYLFFLLETHHSIGNDLGFPIYDSIALDLQLPLMKKLRIRYVSRKDMVRYVGNMRIILNSLMYLPNDDSSVWKMPQSVCNTQFGLLDYFLWRIGKTGRLSFSLLWSREEKILHYSAVKNLSENIKDNSDLISQKEFYSLPSRFKKWYLLYASIKNNRTTNK